MKQKLTDATFYLLVIEPYVFTTMTKDDILLYNSKNGKKLKFSSSSLLSILHSKKHFFYNYFCFTSIELMKVEINNFINKIIKSYFGFVINHEGSDPIQFEPQTYIPEFKRDFDENLLSYISQIDILLTYKAVGNLFDTEQILPLNFRMIHKLTFDLNDVILFLEPLLFANIYVKVNLIGNIFIYPQYALLLNFLNNNSKYFKIYNLLFYKDVLENIDSICEYYKPATILTVQIDCSINRMLLIRTIKLLNDNNINYNIQALVAYPKEIKYLENILAEFSNVEIVFKPSFNNKNISFFEKYVYLDENEIINLKPTYIEVLKNQKLNNLDFGKLTIHNNSNVFANPFNKKLGVINKNNLEEIVNRELTSGNSWLKIRKNVKPCKYCKYVLLCPPISIYEYALGKFNLCTLNK